MILLGVDARFDHGVSAVEVVVQCGRLVEVHGGRVGRALVGRRFGEYEASGAEVVGCLGGEAGVVVGGEVSEGEGLGRRRFGCPCVGESSPVCCGIRFLENPANGP